ncbi:flavin reductase family protein [Roseospirillum parvum]|uniref:NADH-FMN oxidoreductase RutF, flavin reductase (DIM6/NTAB) family n=1 Tax=Roseospirillum parvum TaxID=83401 RepID=A0A1G7X390_9PROT|nr:flavin reductase family protein [Roseospirillum parvum]SDG78616.1 NADH-FMN oxidoreductase RutF, flavin reductase (DIM6/NTAB) family [Roseospirillum parvum]
MTADSRAFRSALGLFATGVTVVTTGDGGGRTAGMTVNSFSSVSLDPPLILWCLGKGSPSQPVFEAAGHFAVNVLAAGQEALSTQFARPGDKFAGVDWRPGRFGDPLIEGAIATFECRTTARHDAGDHLILVGQVAHFDHRDGEPLLFFGGRYGRLTSQ